MREPSVILVGTASVLTLGLAGFALEGPGIQAEIQARTAAALADVGVRNLSVQTNGRDVTLSGTVAFVEIGMEAARRAAAAPGVRRVENRLEMAMGPSFELAPEGDIWLLRGKMPTPESRQELFDAAAAIVGQGNVIDETEVDDSVTEPPWLGALPRLIQLLRRLDGAPGLRLEDGILTLTGHTSSEGLRDHLKDEIASIQTAANAGWQIADRMRISPVATNHEAENRIKRVLERGLIQFEAGTSTLTEEGRTIVDEIGATLANISDIRVEILVHADTDGDPAANRALSLEQARAVRDVLSASIRPDRLLAVGYGSGRQPVADDDDATDGIGPSTPRIEFRALHRP
ncbi:MAG: OmpA family protein [Acidobacteria bacterium]|nr:OmpA family protein [Acidobacteriota bacterium]